MNPHSQVIDAASEAALSALTALDEMERHSEFSGLRAAACRQLREALADVITSTHRWQFAETVLNEREKQTA